MHKCFILNASTTAKELRFRLKLLFNWNGASLSLSLFCIPPYSIHALACIYAYDNEGSTSTCVDDLFLFESFSYCRYWNPKVDLTTNQRFITATSFQLWWQCCFCLRRIATRIANEKRERRERLANVLVRGTAPPWSYSAEAAVAASDILGLASSSHGGQS